MALFVLWAENVENSRGRHKVRTYIHFHAGQQKRVQNRYNLSVPSVLFRDLGLPTVPQNQRDTFTALASGAKGRRFESCQAYQLASYFRYWGMSLTQVLLYVVVPLLAWMILA